jgi:TP901 family phage tail tape measure protein
MAKNVDIVVALKDMFSGELKKVLGGLEGMKQVTQTITDSVFNLTNAFAAMITGGALGGAVSKFAEFDDIMREVKAISGATGEAFERLTEKALQIGETTSASSSDAARAMKELAAAGLKEKEVFDTLEPTLYLAQGAHMEMANASEFLISVLKSYQMDASQAAKVTDVMTSAANASSASVPQFAEAWKYASGSAQAAGVLFEDLTTALGLIHNAGHKGSIAGTEFNSMLREMQNPSNAAKETIAKLGERLGITGYSFLDTAGKVRPLNEIIGELTRANISGTEAIVVFGDEGRRAYNAMATQGVEGFTTLRQEIEWTEGKAKGSGKRVAYEMEAGIGGALRELSSAWEAVNLAFGKGTENKLLPIIKSVKDAILGLKENIKELAKDGAFERWGALIGEVVKNTIENFKTLAGIVMKITEFFGPLIEQLISLSPILVPVGIAVVGLATAFNQVFGAASLAVSSFISVGNALSKNMAIGKYVVELTTYIKGVQDMVKWVGLWQTATHSLKDALTIATGVLGAFFLGWQIGTMLKDIDVVKGTVQMFFVSIEKGFSTIKRKFYEAKKAWYDFWGNAAGSAAAEAKIQQQRELYQQVELTEQAILEEGKSAKDTAFEVIDYQDQALEATFKRIDANKKLMDDQMSGFDKVNQAAKESLNKQVQNFETLTAKRKEQLAQEIASVVEAEQAGTLSAEEAAKRKTALEKQYFAERMDKLREFLSQMKQAGFTEGDQYKKYLEELKQTANQLNRISVAEARIASAERMKVYYAEVDDRRRKTETLIREINAQEKTGVFNQRQAADERRRVEEDFANFRIKKANEIMNLYPKDSKEYLAAANMKQQAEADLQGYIAGTGELIDENTQKVRQQAEEVQSLAETYASLTGDNKKTTVLSKSQAMSQSMYELTSKGLSAALQRLGLTAEYQKWVNTIKRYGGETEGIDRRDLSEVKSMAESLQSKAESAAKEKTSAVDLDETRRDLSATADEISAFQTSVQGLDQQNITLNFKGTGSATLPLSEKIAEMKGKVTAFVQDVGREKPSLITTLTSKMQVSGLGDQILSALGGFSGEKASGGVSRSILNTLSGVSSGLSNFMRTGMGSGSEGGSSGGVGRMVLQFQINGKTMEGLFEENQARALIDVLQGAQLRAV